MFTSIFDVSPFFPCSDQGPGDLQGVLSQGLAQPKHRSGRRRMFDHLTGSGWNWDKLQSFGNISNELYPNFWKLSPWSYSNKPSMALSIGDAKKGKILGQCIGTEFPIDLFWQFDDPWAFKIKADRCVYWLRRGPLDAADGFILENLRCTCD